jgi:ribose transport system ATP-binding protein
MSQLSILENVFYQNLSTFVFQKQTYREILSDLMETFRIPLDPDTPVTRLTHAETIWIELLKAYVMKRRVIVLADVSYYLTGMEMEAMFAMVQRMKDRGFAFILIDSARGLLLKHADLFCFIRQGRTAGFFTPSELSDDAFRRILWQEEAPASVPAGSPWHMRKSEAECARLAFANVGFESLHGLSFEVFRGKLLKMMYLEEKDGDALLTLLRGEKAPALGEILLSGRRYRPKGMSGAQKQGLCFVEDNPAENLLLPQMSVMDNLGLAMWRKSPWLWLRGQEQKSLRQTLADICGEDFWEIPVAMLTPAQAQKLVYAKWLLFNPSAVVCVNPFTGMDYQVDGVTESMLQRMLAKSIAVLIVASYLPAMSTQGETLYLVEGGLTDRKP